jgi:hypothetical protein
MIHCVRKQTTIYLSANLILFTFIAFLFSSCKKVENNPVADISVVAKAGEDMTVNVGESAVLDGSASTVSDPSAIPAYAWVFVSKPSGSDAVIDNPLSDETSQSSFTPDIEGIYAISLTVWANGIYDSDTVIVTAIASGMFKKSGAND